MNRPSLSCVDKAFVCLALAAAVTSISPLETSENAEEISTTPASIDFIRFCVARSSTALSCSNKASILTQLCFSTRFTRDIADELLCVIKFANEDLRSTILSEVQSLIACKIMREKWDGDQPACTAGLLNIWENVLQSWKKAEEVDFAAAMTEMLLMAIDRVCCELNDSYSLLEHYRQYEQLGVLGQLVRATVCRLREGTAESREGRSRALAALTQSIVNMVDGTARFPLVTALLHATVRDIVG